METEAIPYEVALAVSPSRLALVAIRPKPPARNMAMPWPTEPQYKVQRRPMRSSVKTQIRVENYVKDVNAIPWYAAIMGRTM